METPTLPINHASPFLTGLIGQHARKAYPSISPNAPVKSAIATSNPNHEPKYHMITVPITAILIHTFSQLTGSTHSRVGSYPKPHEVTKERTGSSERNRHHLFTISHQNVVIKLLHPSSLPPPGVGASHMPIQQLYAVVDDHGAAEIFKTWRECAEFKRNSPSAKLEIFEDEDEAWDWIIRNTPLDPDSDATTEHESYFASQREQSALGSDYSCSASPGQDCSQSLVHGFVPSSQPWHDGSSIFHLKPPSQSKSQVDFDTDYLSSPPKLRTDEDIVLSAEQLEIVRICEQGESIFFTGSAGTGKSVCLRAIIERLRTKYGTGSVFVTASTGIAAINVGGSTLHSFAGIGLGKSSVEKLYRKIVGPLDGNGKERRNKSKAEQRWGDARVLVIDEISMIDGRLFDKLERLARMIRGEALPFGGIQLIVCGDFFQLPPVPDFLSTGQKIPIKFAFEAESWERCIPRVVSLSKVFRQKEGDLIAVLNMMRLGEVSSLGWSIFRAIEREVQYEDDIKPTELFPLRCQVEEANNTRLEALSGEEQTFYAKDIAYYDMYGHPLTRERASRLLDNTLAPSELRLRLGAQVMLIKNMSAQERLVNGSIGIVIGFKREKEMEPTERIPPHKDGQKPTSAPPLKFMSRWPHNQGPTRCRHDHSTTDGKEEGSKKPRWPVVRFANKVEKLVTPDFFEAVNAIGDMEATRLQLPLILAWAISIHKSQGQTLQRVKVDMNGIFEKGQAYVALSRATSLEGLQVLNFDQERIKVHPRVLAWSEEMTGVEETGRNPGPHDSDEEMYWAEVG